MKNLFLLFVLSAFSLVLPAQQVGINMRIDAAKSFKFDKKTRLEVSQQLQINPEIKNINKRYYRIFDELELFPFLKDDDKNAQRDDDNDDDDDDKKATSDNAGSTPSQQAGAFNELNDAAYAIDLRWRSSSTVDFDYKIRKWLRFGQSYSLLLDAEDLRHLSRTDLTFKPNLPVGKLALEYRIAYQLGATPNKGKIKLDSDFSSRAELEWEFKDKHIWFSTVGINGAFDAGNWEWDRFRCDTGLEYELSKTQSFSFGYRFQQRLNRKKNAVSHGVSFSYSLDF